MDRFNVWLANADPLVTVIGFLLARASVIVFPPLQGWPLDGLAEQLWGWQGAVVLSEIGIAIGASIAYFLGTRVSRYAVEESAMVKKAQEWESAFRRQRWLAWFALRLVSNPLFDVICYAAGVLRIPFVLFISTTVVGSLPTMALYMWGIGRAGSGGVTHVVLFIAGFLLLSIAISKVVLTRVAHVPSQSRTAVAEGERSNAKD